MKKYTNKILLVTFIVVLLGMVIGYTVNFQSHYRKGEISFEKIEKVNVDSVGKAFQEMMDAEEDEGTSSDKQTETSNQ